MNLNYERTNVWEKLSEEEHKKVFEYGDRYKAFLDSSKTEREAVKTAVKIAEKAGFLPMEKALKGNLTRGSKFYLNQKGKALVLFVLGENIEDGMNIVGSHLDCPRLDVKQVPLFEGKNLCMLKTHYYGGVKKYQWPTIQLAIHGVVYTKNGEKIELSIGEKEDDPVFYINDLLIHLSAEQMKKTLAEGISGEALNVVVGHSSYRGIDQTEKEKKEDKTPVKSMILKYLNETYGMVEEDFMVSELEIVPAAKARDVGFDRSMIAAHGHDDRVCSYAALESICSIENPKRTAVALLVDKEEIGSVGNASMNSRFFEDAVAEIIHAQGGADIISRRAIRNSKVLSADVTCAIDPIYHEVSEPMNSSLSGCGVTISKYTGSRGKSGSNDANAEFLQELRMLFDENEVIWQTGELGKIDAGGGGTIAYILANYGAEVVDIGTGMLSMHAPIELLSKADSYMTMKAYHAFLK